MHEPMREGFTPVIHVATVHMDSGYADWAGIQHAYLSRHMSAPFQLYGFFESDPGEMASHYRYASWPRIREHATKLNLLGDIICFASRSDDDWILFIDGDAFPVGDIVGYLHAELKKHPLVAVQRLENRGDIQPHPSFCATTVGFWKSIRGDWSKGYKWVNSEGMEVSDVGGALLGVLREKGLEWKPMLRSNRLNLHPLLFGIYEDLIYHHGAGFRQPVLRADSPAFSSGSPRSSFWERLVDWVLPPNRDALWIHRARMILSSNTRKARAIVKDNERLSLGVIAEMQSNPHFFERFLGRTEGS